MERVEMHHIRHVRKKNYSFVPGDQPWKQVMSLRNRKQIPVCRTCHIAVIHAGEHDGKKIEPFTLTGALARGYDNRIINSENYIHRGIVDKDYHKTLYERGWKQISSPSYDVIVNQKI
jgi:hypothetical protein